MRRPVRQNLHQVSANGVGGHRHRLQHSSAAVYHRGPSWARYYFYCTPLTCLQWSRVVVFATISMRTIRRFTATVLRTRHWNSWRLCLSASMTSSRGCTPTGSSWIQRRPRFCGLSPVDVFISCRSYRLYAFASPAHCGGSWSWSFHWRRSVNEDTCRVDCICFFAVLC